MDDFEDFRTYDGDNVHDMWVDYDYHVNTGELDFIEDDEDYEDEDMDDY